MVLAATCALPASSPTCLPLPPPVWPKVLELESQPGLKEQRRADAQAWALGQTYDDKAAEFERAFLLHHHKGCEAGGGAGRIAIGC